MITFTRVTTTVDRTTGLASTVTTTIDGEVFFKAHGDPMKYEALKLRQSMAPTLIFTPNGYPKKAFTPEFVMEGDTCILNGVKMTVRDVDPVCPDGTVVIAYIIVSV